MKPRLIQPTFTLPNDIGQYGPCYAEYEGIKRIVARPHLFVAEVKSEGRDYLNQPCWPVY